MYVHFVDGYFTILSELELEYSQLKTITGVNFGSFGKLA